MPTTAKMTVAMAIAATTEVTVTLAIIVTIFAKQELQLVTYK